MQEKTEKRCYVFPHFMLSNITKGIQSSHAIVNMFNKYVPHKGNDYEVPSENDVERDPFEILFDWSLNHKTEIMLNPGVSENLNELLYFLQDPENFYPWAEFHEDEYSLKGVMTAISIVLPEKIYFTASLLNKRKICIGTNNFDQFTLVSNDGEKGYSTEEVENIKLIQSYGKFSDFEMELVQRLTQYKLAN